MLKAYTDAYRVFGEPEFLKKAYLSAAFIETKLIRDNKILRVYNSSNRSEEWSGSFLDDYAFVIDGFIGLYKLSRNIKRNVFEGLATFCLLRIYTSIS